MGTDIENGTGTDIGNGKDLQKMPNEGYHLQHDASLQHCWTFPHYSTKMIETLIEQSSCVKIL